MKCEVKRKFRGCGFVFLPQEGWYRPRIFKNMKRVTRGEKILDSMVNDPHCELTEAGKNWLIQVCDPFHDRPFIKTGWPDNNNRPSVLRQVKVGIPLSAVSGGGAAVTAPWDCHIAWMPVLNSGSVYTSTTRGNTSITYSPTVASSNVGGLMCRASFSSGTAVEWMPASGGATDLGDLNVSSAYLTGDSRLVAIGFEVTDTSAEINKQGVITTYTYPQLENEENYEAFDTTKPAGTIRSYRFRGRKIILPPTTVADALLLPDTRQWEARYGAYVVPSFINTDNKAYDATTIQPVYESATTGFTPGVQTNAQIWFPQSASVITQISGAVTYESVLSPVHKLSPTNSSGVILSGLHPSSTFNVSMVYYIETIPRLNDVTSIVLTQPPPAFDPCALQIYNRIITRLPPATMVGDNASGQWFWNVVEQVAKFAYPIIKQIPHPYAQVAAPIVKQAGKSAGAMKEQQPQGKKKEKQGKQVQKSAAVSAQPSQPIKPRSKPLPPIPKKARQKQ